MRTMFTFGTCAIYMLYSLILEIKYFYLGKIGKIKEQEDFLHRITIHWSKTMIKSTGSKVEVLGLENIPDCNVLFVTNHQGYADIPLILGYIPKLKGIVAKIELKKIPILSGWMMRLGCIFLDRSSLRQSMQMILNGIEDLKNGHTLAIFPEGTRSRSKQVGEFKKGSLQLAIKSGVPVVPITIDGSYKVYEEFNKVRPAQLKVIVHPPIYMENLSSEEKKNLAEIVRNIISMS